ncbi:hypothetical protein CEXT_289871 [Caerostris extrusa]|uniref:Uncharacterized protein n=1 Tax=Caerostris extrusa TaxID=172846 RepID=A0AAV4Q2D5_CAEEX|nr:hypothetical protein CEXT_289871 [Caerostris extrusa]
MAWWPALDITGFAAEYLFRQFLKYPTQKGVGERPETEEGKLGRVLVVLCCVKINAFCIDGPLDCMHYLYRGSMSNS